VEVVPFSHFAGYISLASSKEDTVKENVTLEIFAMYGIQKLLFPRLHSPLSVSKTGAEE